jgi:hypothetical protein
MQNGYCETADCADAGLVVPSAQMVSTARISVRIILRRPRRLPGAPVATEVPRTVSSRVNASGSVTANTNLNACISESSIFELTPVKARIA